MKNELYSPESLSKYLSRGYIVQTDNDKIVTLVRNRKVGIFWNLVLTLVTGGWWLFFWIYRVLTKNSVLYLYKDQSLMPAPMSNPVQLFVSWVSGKFSSLSARSKIFVAGALALTLVATFLVSNFATSNEMNNEEEKEKQLSYETWSPSLDTPLDNLECSSLATAVTSGENISFAKKTRNKATTAVKNISVWTAENYISKNKWVNEARSLKQSFDYELKNVIEPILNERVEALESEIASSSLFQRKSPWQSTFLAFAIYDCGLSADFEKSLDTVSQVQTSAISIRTAASNKPWYPKGFELIGGYTDFAYKNSASGCSYSFGSCATFKIVSKTGCPTSLYVETNLLRNGEVVDWSNDTARGLAPGQVAAMETTFTKGDGAGSWTFTDISCY